MKTLPLSAQVIVIGGGIVGCSTAYHLAQLGVDTVLLERHKLTSGTTFHAAGLVGQLRSNANITQLLGESVSLYKRLEAETGAASGWKMNGGLRLACNAARWTEVRRQAVTARSFGLDMQLLTPSEAQSLWPLMDVGDVVGAAFLPTDGQANPSDITQALARGARQAGAIVVEDVAVSDLLFDKNRITAVVTDAGTIRCSQVVCCAGQWTREFAGQFGVNVPLVSVEHQYLVTESIPGVSDTLPTLRDPDRLTYYKEEVGGLIMGGYESNPIAWAVNGIPDGFHFSLLDSNVDHFEPMMALALGRVPALADAGIKQLINGPESFTPDGNFILGEAPELPGFFIGAGFNAYGIAAGGGAGMALAEWVHTGQAPFDLWPVDIRRFGAPHRHTEYVRKRTLEAYARHYTMAWPHEEPQAGRPCRRSPLFETLKAQGACFGEKLGWERPNWFADLAAGEKAVDQYSFERPAWHEAVAREHHALRQQAAVIDQTSFAKFVLRGPDALAALQWLAANDIDKPVGSLTYTQMLDDHGGIQCDLTVARVAENAFYLVTGTGFATHDYDWINRQMPAGANARLMDVTSGSSVLSLMGPKSRDVLQRITEEDVSDQAFPFGSTRLLGIAGCMVRALRVTYVGELGWELHLPVENAAGVYEALMAAGADFGIANAGYRAIESCRLEKGYRAWGSDIGPDHTPLEAGLGWALRTHRSDVPFKGRAAILRQSEAPQTKCLAGFSIDVPSPSTVLLGRETLYRNGERVGWLSSGGYGHTLGKAIGYGYVRQPAGLDDAYVLDGDYELDLGDQRIACAVHLKPLYDPQSLRIRA